MIALTIGDIDGFVTKLQHKGIDVRWEGWTVVFHETDPNAYRNPAGHFHSGTWGFETRVSANGKGQWLIDRRLARRNAGRR